MKRYGLRGLWSLLMPRVCLRCGARLRHDEHTLCPSCLSLCPDHIHSPLKMEALEYRLREELPLVHARSLYRYGKDPEARRIVFELKYNGRAEMARWMARQLVRHLQGTDFFEGVDCLVPVPLHPQRLRKRGYNQAERLAQGLSELTGIPVCQEAVRRVSFTRTQTRLDSLHRQRNVQHAFVAGQVDNLTDKHVIIVDDVLTTGATVTACGRALSAVKGLRVSVLTFAYVDHGI
jgi:ComF family protein